jgi:hypothetical protein
MESRSWGEHILGVPFRGPSLAFSDLSGSTHQTRTDTTPTDPGYPQFSLGAKLPYCL